MSKKTGHHQDKSLQKLRNKPAGFFRRFILTLMIVCFANASLTGTAQAVSLIRDAEIEAFLRELTDPVLVAAGLQPDAVSIYLVGDQSLNAFVAGGKNIFLHTGLIVEAERPMELVGVIAHETGHIAGGHLSRGSDGAKRATLPMLVGMGAGILAALAGAPDVGMALMAGGQHIGMMEYLAYSRTQESAADQAAMTYMDRAGIAPDGLLTFFEKFRYTEVFATNSQLIPPYWRTHPMSSDRISALSQRVSDSPYQGLADDPEHVRRYDMMRAKLRGFLDQPYATLRRYPVEDTSPAARYARAVAYYRMVEIDLALSEIDALIAGEPDNPYFYELRGQILFETGRVEDAIPFHSKAVDLAPNEPLLRVNLAQAMIAQPDSEDDLENNLKARAQLEIALAADKENSFAYHQLAITYAREDNEGMAALSTAERYYHVGDMMSAASFASRATNGLDRGTPAWQRASDIMNVARNAQNDRRR